VKVELAIQQAEPCGLCWCGCGGVAARGKLFKPGCDRIASSHLLRGFKGRCDHDATANLLKSLGFDPVHNPVYQRPPKPTTVTL